MAVSAPVGTKDISCDDFLAFEEVLRNSRDIDDKIIYALNQSIPTRSFSANVDASSTCKQLFDKLRESNQCREQALSRCIGVTSAKVSELRDRRQQRPDDELVARQLRQEQCKLRMYRSEKDVEEVVRDRSIKSWTERCRLFYSPQHL